MPHLICYDIAKNSLRAKLSRTILDYGLDRINKSVYLGTIKEVGLKELEGKLATWMKEKGESNDSLIILPVHGYQVQNMRVYGKNDLDKEELKGDKTTLIL